MDVEASNSRELPPQAEGQALDPQVFFLLNAHAGSVEVERLRGRIDDVSQSTGVPYQLVIRHKSEERRCGITRNAIADGYRTIVAVGGDGTVSQVAESMIGSDAVLAIVPAGTANLIARDLRIPLDQDEALELAFQGRTTRALDGMCVGERVLFSHVSMGVYSQIVDAESESQKRLFGRAAYLWNLTRGLAAGKRWKFDLTIDGDKHAMTASLVLAANVAATGIGHLQWGSRIRPDDGVVNVCVVRGRTILDYAGLLIQSMRGRPEASARVDRFAVHQYLQISTNAGLPVRGDGKEIGNGLVALDVLPAAVRVIIPSDQR